MNRALIDTVRARAFETCEYCQLTQAVLPVPFQIDHIIPEKHGGKTVESNLALACPHCNLRKGTNIAGIDAEFGEIVRLYNPRTDLWAEHFQFDGIRIIGRSPIGNVTIQVLAMNADELLFFRAELIQEG